MGEVAFRKKDYAGAIQPFTQAIRLKPDYTDAYGRRASSYGQSHDIEHALADLNTYVTMRPDDAWGYQARCWSRTLLGREYDQAITDCNKALTLKPDYYDAMDARGFLNLRMGHDQQAADDFSLRLKDQPNRATSLYGRGLAKRHLGDTAGGDADVAAARAVDPLIDTYYRFLAAGTPGK
jgi:tetratricopeptide (TPR) repeat protein